MSKFKIVVSVLVVAMVCAIGIEVNYLWKIKSELDRLYWISENTESALVGVAIDYVEADLRQHLTQLTVLIIMLPVTIIVSWMLNRIYIKHKETRTQEMKKGGRKNENV